MASLDTFIADTAQFQKDVTAALARAQASIDALKTTGGLTPEQQAAVDSADASLKAADAVAQGFDVPPAPPAA